MEYYIYHKTSLNNSPPEYHLLFGNINNVSILILKNNKFNNGHNYLLKFLNNNFDKIVNKIDCDIILNKLEKQDGLSPWINSWWNSEVPLITMDEILDIGIKNKTITIKKIIKEILKSDDYIYFLKKIDLISV